MADVFLRQFGNSVAKPAIKPHLLAATGANFRGNPRRLEPDFYDAEDVKS